MADSGGLYMQMAIYAWLMTSLYGCQWCEDVSKERNGAAYSCSHCRNVPQGLPRNISRLSVTHFHTRYLGKDALAIYKNLTELTLENSGRRLEMTSQIFHASSRLRKVFITKCEMTKLPKLPTSLTELHADDNKITAILLRNLPQLTQLAANNNAIMKFHLQDAGGGAGRSPGNADQLQRISLCRNRLKSAMFSHFRNLWDLRLSHNNLAGFGSSDDVSRSELQLPASLQILYVDHNYISNLDGLRLPVLHSLLAQSNEIRFIPANLLKDLPSLRLLDLRDNPLTSVDGVSAALLSNVATLRLPQVAMTQARAIEVTLHPDRPFHVWMVAFFSSFLFLIVAIIGIVVFCLPKDMVRGRFRRKRLMTATLNDKYGVVATAGDYERLIKSAWE